MNRIVALAGFLTLLVGAGTVWGDPTPETGSYAGKAISINPQTAPFTVTLVREWDPESPCEDHPDADPPHGWYMDGFPEETAIDNRYGVCWYKISIEKGKDYLIWMTEDADIDNYIAMDIVCGDEAVSTEFQSYWAADGTEYRYLKADGWDEFDNWISDGTVVTFYIQFYQNVPKKSCTFRFQQRSIAEVAPRGSVFNPISLDLTRDGRETVADPNDESIGCHYRITLQPNVPYTFMTLPRSDDAQGFITYALDDEYMEALIDEPVNDFDAETGIYTLKLLSPSNTTATMIVSGSDISKCDLLWRNHPEIGDVGFARTDYAVDDTDGQVSFELLRTSVDCPMRIRWMTVAETATAGLDYEPCSGEVVFEANGAKRQSFTVPLKAGLPADEGQKIFAVRLESVPEDELKDGEVSPVPNPAVATVAIRPSGAVKPEPEMPKAQDEPPSKLLSVGTFRGVLTGGGSLLGDCTATVELTGASDGTLSASLTLADGTVRLFTGASGRIDTAATIAGKSWTSIFAVSLPEGRVGDLTTGPGGSAALDGSVHVEVDGQVDEVFLSGNLYRVESQLDSATLMRMMKKAGRYTLTLENGAFLSLNVAGNGQTDVRGASPAEGEFGFQAEAFDVAEGLAIPSPLGTIVVDRGYYDGWTRLERLYAGWTLAVNDKSSPLDGLELTAEGERFVADGVSLTLDRETGLISGSKGDVSFTGVLINDVFEQGSVGLYGYLTGGAAAGTPFEMDLQSVSWDCDENWGTDIAVTFDANGGAGSVPAPIAAQLGGTVEMPACALTRFGYQFIGWLNPNTARVLTPQTVIKTPPQDTKFVAQWSDVQLKLALDSDLDFFADPEGSWVRVVDAAKAACGDSYAKATLGESVGVQKVLSTKVSGKGSISFSWALVRRIDGDEGPLDDNFSCYVDGELVRELAGRDVAAFESAEFRIDSYGEHEVKWIYWSAATAASWLEREGQALLDDVQWLTESLNRVSICLDAGPNATVYPTNKFCAAGSAIGSLPVAVAAAADRTFDHWEDAEGTTVTSETIAPFGGTTLYAVWAVTVTFDGDGATGKAPDQLYGLSGASVEMPGRGELVKTGYRFVGWTDGAAVYKKGEQYELPRANQILTAVWEDERLKQALDTTCPVVESPLQSWQVVASSKSLKAAKGESYLKSVGTWQGEKVAELSIPVSGAGTLTFYWGLIRRSDGDFGTQPDTFKMFVDDQLITDIAKRDVSPFDRFDWQIDDPGDHVLRWVYDCSEPGSWLENELTAGAYLDAVTWEPDDPNRVTIVLDPGKYGSVSETNIYRSAGSPFGELPEDADSPCQVFDCWADDKGARISEEMIVPVGGMTLHAVWKVRLSFDGNGATGGSVPDPEVVAAGAQVGIPEDKIPERTGYVFNGWTDGTLVRQPGETYVVGETNVTLLSVWKDERLKLALDTDLDVAGNPDGTWQPVESESPKVVGGSYLRAPGTATGGTAEVVATGLSGKVMLSFHYGLVRRRTSGGVLADVLKLLVDGEEFWSLSGKDQDPFGFVGDIIINTEGDHVLKWVYACAASDQAVVNGDVAGAYLDCIEWVPLSPDLETIELDPGAEATVPQARVYRIHGDPFGILPPDAVSEVKDFAYWADGDGTRITEETIVPVGGMTLHAVWNVTLTFDGNGATGTGPDPISGLVGGEVKLPDCGGFAKTGYEFAGWTDGGAPVKAGGTYVLPDRHRTLQAVWEDARLKQALDTDLTVTESPDKVWNVVEDARFAVKGGSYLRKGIDHEGAASAELSMSVKGSGVLTFHWGLVRRVDGDFGEFHDSFSLTVDGAEKKRLSDQDVSKLTACEVRIETTGTHAVKWTYLTPSEYDNWLLSEGYAFIDCVTWQPDKSAAVVTLTKGAGVSDVVVSNGTERVVVKDGRFEADSGTTLDFYPKAAALVMPTFSAQCQGAEAGEAEKVAYGHYRLVIGESDENVGVTFLAKEAGEVADETEALEALVNSVTVPAAGKTVAETRQMVAGQVAVIQCEHTSARVCDIATWIAGNGFSGAQVAQAKEIGLSYGLQATTLFVNDPVSKIVSMTVAEPDAGKDLAYELVFRICDGADGAPAIAAATAEAKAYVATLVKTTQDLADWHTTVPEVAISAGYAAATSEIKVKVSLPGGYPQVFMKVER